MTMHYAEDKITAKQIWQGWTYHSRKMPACYAVATISDSVAYNIWQYLDCLEKRIATSVDKFWSGYSNANEMITLTEQVVEIYLQDKMNRNS